MSRPQNGSVILYNRKKVKYRKDGYCWKKRKDGKTTREDHMKLKVQGVEVGGLQNNPPSPQKCLMPPKKSALSIKLPLVQVWGAGNACGGGGGRQDAQEGGQRVLGALKGQL